MPWETGDFQEVLDHLRARGFYLFQGELIAPLGRHVRRPPSPDCSARAVSVNGHLLDVALIMPLRDVSVHQPHAHAGLVIG